MLENIRDKIQNFAGNVDINNIVIADSPQYFPPLFTRKC